MNEKLRNNALIVLAWTILAVLTTLNIALYLANLNLSTLAMWGKYGSWFLAEVPLLIFVGLVLETRRWRR